MEESRWHNSAEAYRAVQALVREGRYADAIDRARGLLQEGGLGRKQSARLHSQICWLYVEQMHKTCPVAALHGEEALRLAVLVGDQWIRSEALIRLVHTYCRLGDPERARQACRQVAQELESNENAVVGGTAALLQLEATIAQAEGDAESCLSALGLADELSRGHAPPIRARICLQKALALLEYGRYDEADALLQEAGPPPQAAPDVLLEWDLARTWLDAATATDPDAISRVADLQDRAAGAGNAVAVIHCLALQALLTEQTEAGEAARLARLALDRAISTGRVDLTRALRRRLGHLLCLHGA